MTLAFSQAAQELKRGQYRHKKGSIYTVVDVVHHSETHEELVLYRRDEDNQLWVRPLAMFTEDVDWPDGVRRPRFEYIGEGA